MRNRVLILSISRKVSLVKAFKDSGFHVIGQDLDPNAVALKFCDEIAHPNTEIGFDLVVPTRDAELIDWAEHPATFMSNKETIRLCQNKLLFARALADTGLQTPKVLFCKPREGSGSRDASMVYQEFIKGEEYSIDLFADKNSQVINFVPRKRIKVVNGESCVSQTVEHTPFTEEVIRLSTTLGLVGHCVLQCFLTRNGLVWLEVNPRFGGASAVGVKAGCKSPEYMLKLINGEKIPSQMGNYRVGVMGRSYSEWTFDCMNNSKDCMNFMGGVDGI